MLQTGAERNVCPFLSSGAIAGCPGNPAEAAPRASGTSHIHLGIKGRDGVTGELGDGMGRDGQGELSRSCPWAGFQPQINKIPAQDAPGRELCSSKGTGKFSPEELG